jgi:amino acid transporter
MTALLARDAGLRRCVGAWGLGAAVVNGVVGAGIFALPASMARDAGGLAPLAYLLCAGVFGMIVTCLAEAGSRMPTSGGIYGYVAYALGPLAGFVCGMMTWLASVLACGGIAGAFAATLGSVAPVFASGAGRVAVILLAIGGIALVNLRGVRGGAALVSAVTALKLLPLLLFVGVGALWLPAAGPPTASAPATGFGEAVILAAFAFSGMETVLGVSGEVARPHRNLPLGLFGAMGFVLVLYVGIQIVAQRLLGPDLAQATAPLAQAAARISPVAGLVLVAGAGISMLGWIGSDILGAPRILFAFARDGLLPRLLGRADPRTGAPDAAIVVHAAIAAGFALSGSFTGLVVASTLSTAAVYFLGCAAAWVLHRDDTRSYGEPLDLAVLPAACVGGMASMVALVCVAPRSQIFGLGAVILVSAVLYGGVRAAGSRARA